MKSKTITLSLTLIFVCLFIFSMLAFPQSAKEGAIKGILLCSKVIIPSLFPFTFCVIMIIKSNITQLLNCKINKYKYLNNLNTDTAIVFFLSLIGGYPIGAKLIDELYSEGKISKMKAHIMQYCCVNAGPAFIVLFVGNNIYHSAKAGYILLFSHIFSSFLFFVLFSFKKESNVQKYKNAKLPPLSELFVESVSSASQTVFSICSYVILFSTVNEIIIHLSSKLKALTVISYLLEVTVGVNNTKNIYLTAFLLGFAGISIWLQIYSVSKNAGINLKYFVLFRVFHGVLSAIITYILVKIFKPYIYVISTGKIETVTQKGTAEIILSIAIMIILLIISLESKKICRKKAFDIV